MRIRNNISDKTQIWNSYLSILNRFINQFFFLNLQNDISLEIRDACNIVNNIANKNYAIKTRLLQNLRTLSPDLDPNLSFPRHWFITIHGRIIRLRATIHRNSMKRNICRHPAGEKGRGRKRERASERDKRAMESRPRFRSRSSSRNEVNGIYIYMYIYKRGSEHRGRNPNLITSGPPAVDSIFKMTGGRDGCDVTLRRRLKPY